MQCMELIKFVHVLVMLIFDYIRSLGIITVSKYLN